MQVTETKNEGLKREYKVKLDAKSINDKSEQRLVAMSKNMKLDGFRKGKIPLKVLKQRFGKSIMGEVLEMSVNEASQKIMRDKKLTPAMAPKLEVTAYEEGGDLDFTMECEILPEVNEIELSKINLEKLVVDVEDKEIDEAVGRLADRNKVFKREEGAKAKKGNRVLIDFTGSIDGVEFEGGTAKKFALELGSGSFIGDFEDQLVGSKEGSDITVKVSFPKNYHKQELAGKPAQFAVHVHEVQVGERPEVNDEFAKKFGFNELDALKDAVRGQTLDEYEASARMKIKKQLFDELDEKAKFPVPQTMVDLEFKSIWEKLEQAKKEGDEALEGKSDDELRSEYGVIATRRVKLGILLSDIATKNKLQVTNEEVQRAVMQQAQQYPGQERAVFEFYKKNPQHLRELHGPILEEKAVDFIIAKAKVTERKVSPEEIMEEIDDGKKSKEARKEPKKKAANS